MQRARDDLVREQRTTMSQIQEERRSLATERAQLSSAHRDLISREKLKTETSVQVRVFSVCLTLNMYLNVDNFVGLGPNPSLHLKILGVLKFSQLRKIGTKNN